MNKVNIQIIFASVLTVLSLQVSAQSYKGYGYANGVAGARYQMPGKVITENSGIENNLEGVITGYFFDSALETGPSYNDDIDVTFGIYFDKGTPGDDGGMDKRGYNTKADNATVEKFTPIRWNGGSQLWRQSGQWVRYSIDFQKEKYNFVYRGNTNGYANSAHKFVLKIYEPNDISSPIFERTIDLSGEFPAPSAVSDNVLRIGGGGDETDWFKVLDEIEITQTGTYIVELSSPDAVYIHASWGAFTFNKAEQYDAVAYNGSVWNALTDTVLAWQYDITTQNKFEGGDKDVTVGVYDASEVSYGENVRQYTDNPYDGAVRWNAGAKTFQTNGGWYNYSFKFSGQSAWFFCFNANAQTNNPAFNGTVKILEPKSDLLVAEYVINSHVKFVSDKDAANETRWMYIDHPVMIPEGNYIVKINLPTVSETGILGQFTFLKDQPATNSPQVITYDWPASIKNDPDLFSDLYTVKITQGDNEYEMFTHKSVPDLRPSNYPPDNGGNGVHNTLYDRTFTFCQFAFTDEIDVEVTKEFGGNADRVEIQPKAYGINPYYFDGKTVRFKLKHQQNRPSYISINFVSDDNWDYTDKADGTHKTVKHGMVLFGDKPEVHVPDKDAAGTVIYNNSLDSATIVNADMIYFEPGDYNLKQIFNRGVIDLTRNNQKIYIEGGAVVRGAIWSHGKDNIWLYGRGIITGWDMLFHELLDENGRKEAFLAFQGSEGCHIEGLVITDPTHHTIPTTNNTYFKNLKIIGWAYNQDGTRTGSGSYAEEMFYKTQDDRDYANRNHVIKNSVMWPMRNGAFGVLGWQSFDGGNTHYENLYFINSEWDRPENNVGNQGVIGSKLVQGANLDGDTLRNLFLEDFTTILCVLRIHFDAPVHPFDTQDPGSIKNFLFENIKVEQPFTTSEGVQKYQRIEGYNENGVRPSIHDITFRNLIVAGEPVTDANKSKYFIIDEDVAYNIFFEVSGDLHTIRATSTSGGNIYPSGKNGDIAVPHGTDQYVSIEPNAGYKIKDVKVDGTSVGPLPVISISNVTSDHIVEVEFEEATNTFDLTEIIDPNTVLRNDIDLGVVYVNVNEISDENKMLKVYPNPATNQIKISGVEEKELVRLYNTTGQLVLQSRSKLIDVSGLHSGIYILYSNRQSVKVLVQN